MAIGSKMGWSTCLGCLSMFEIDDDVVQELVGDTWHFVFINPQKKGLNHLPLFICHPPPRRGKAMIDNRLMADIAYNNPCAPVSAVRISLFPLPSLLDRYHRIHPLVVVLASHGTEAAEYLAEGLGTDALHQAGIAAGEVLVDVGGTEQGGGFALTG